MPHCRDQLEIRMLTRVPFATSLPADGVSPTTRPTATVALEAVVATGSRLARLNLASATASVCPTTFGTVT